MNKKGNIAPGIIFILIFLILLIKCSFDIYNYVQIKILPSVNAYIELIENDPETYNITYTVRNVRYSRDLPYSLNDVVRNKDKITLRYHPDNSEEIYFLSGFKISFYFQLLLCILTGVFGLYNILSDKKK